MENLKLRIENRTKTRINVISFVNSGIDKLHELLIRNGSFERTNFLKDNYYSAFSTEILYSSPRNNIINVYLDLKKYGTLLMELKENIFKALYDTSSIIESTSEGDKFKTKFSDALNKLCEVSLDKFFEIEKIEIIFNDIKFQELLREIKKLNNADDEIFENMEELIWKRYFNNFEVKLKKQYCKWIRRIFKYYAETEEGYEYINEEEYMNYYLNKDFDSLCKIIYGNKSSCGLMLSKVYLEVPSSKEQFTGVAYIDCILKNRDKNIIKIIESRISEDYKELFLLVIKNDEDIKYFSKLKESINKITLDKRIFCIFDIANYDKNQLLKCIGLESNKFEDLIDIIKFNISKRIGVSKDKIIITKEFNDLDRKNLSKLYINGDLAELVKMIKKESEDISKIIRIKSASKKNVINISLNQERMSVQALMVMLYERYNGYLVDLWSKIIEAENNKKYSFIKVNAIIRCRKDNYSDYKHIMYSSNNSKELIDFSIRSDEKNDSKKILKMLLNYGYNTVGFDLRENKILINVNGDISKEGKENLIRLIKGRLEESALNYFEDAFLMDISRKKFTINNLKKALEIEKNITIDDFYSAFNEAFTKMSDNIMRYEVYLQ